MANSISAPSSWRVIKSVGWVTFLEVIRDKVLYNVILCGILMFAVGFLASRLSFLGPERIILDFGLMSVSVSCGIIALFSGSALLAREFERRTIYVTLCHPISKAQFLVGKFFGLSGVLAVNWLLLSSSYLVILYFASGSQSYHISWTLIIALLFVWIQSIVLASIAIFFSTFSTTSLSIMMTIGCFCVGINASQMRTIALGLKSPVNAFLLNAVATILPNFEYFSLGTKVTYGLPLPGELVWTSILYGFFVVALFLGLAGLLIRGREV